MRQELELHTWHQMVHVDEALPELTVLFAKVDCANCTCCTVMPYACISGMTIPFVPVHKNLSSLAFRVFGSRHLLVGVDRCLLNLFGAKRPIDSHGTFDRTVRNRMPDTGE